MVTSVLETEYLNTKFSEALEKLDLAKLSCKGQGCSPKVRAKVFIAIGTVLAGGLKKMKEAKEAFAQALKEDPTATPFGDYITAEVQQAFTPARGAAAGGGTEQTTGAAPAAPTKKYRGGRPPRGWKSGEAYFYFSEAVGSQNSQEWADCVANAQASLALENRPTTRFVAATCEEKAGLWIEALGDYQLVADVASNPKVGLFDTANQARARAQALRDKIPKIILRKPAKAEGLVVKMNDAEIPPEKLGGEIWINPGQRAVTATGKVDGVDLEFEQVVDVGEFETATVDIKLGPKGAKGDRAVMKCFAEAKTREDFAKCINGGAAGSKSLTSGLNLRAGFELSGYHDSDHVDVVTPALLAGVESPTDGWGVNGSFLVDVVTAASADIVASASPRWSEVRYVPALGGHKKFGDADVNLHGSLSHEPDYLATGAGAGVAVDFAQKTVTPSLSYDFGYDISGRAGTPFDVFSRKITRHGFDLGLGLVVDKATFLALGLTAVLESGDTSKPYRYVPMFTPEIAGQIQVGQSIDSVNYYRNPERVLEQLPTDRQRWAVAARIAHRFTSSTIRAEERLYVDNWGLKATTTDARYLVDLTKSLRLWPHLRFHAQSGASFWQRAYVSNLTSAGGQVPALRTGDRELGPLWYVTVGGGGRLALGESWGLTVSGDFVYTRYLDHLFILQRLGYFGATSLEVDFE